MDKNNIVENLIKSIITICETFDTEDCRSCSIYSKCCNQKVGEPQILDRLRTFIKPIPQDQTTKIWK